MWIDHIMFALFGLGAFLTVFLNYGNSKKQLFSGIVALLLFASLLIPDVLSNGEIHAVGIAYDAIIMSCLYDVGCKEYQKLILVYAGLIANEFLMLFGVMLFGDIYFTVGQATTWALFIVLIIGLWKFSDGTDGLKRINHDVRRWIYRHKHHA